MAAILCIDDIDQYRLGNLVKGVDITRFQASALYTLGAEAFGKNGKRYRYVKFVDAVTYAAGHVCVLASATTWAVTNDFAGGSALAGLEPVGICLGVPTEGQHGWVQIAGIATVLIEGAAVIAGDRLTVDDAGNDGAAREIVYTTYAAVEERNVGTAMATIADGATGLVFLKLGG